jgi:hypothetical protein
MWYAIEHAYGSHIVVNNGNRADKVYEFSRRALRDAWCSDGPADLTAPGVRTPATSRHPLVRRALTAAHDGDSAAWEVLARQRVDASPALTQYRDMLIDYDWCEPDHWPMVATMKEAELIAWAKATRDE